jgi:hypothetical protein
MKETELGELVIEWLQRERPDWEIFQEIRPTKYAGGHIADIVCLNSEDHVWVIELKTTLNLTVIRQAYSWDVDYRSIAVPAAKRQSTKDERHWWYNHMRYAMSIGTLIATSLGRYNNKQNHRNLPVRKNRRVWTSRRKSWRTLDPVQRIYQSGKTVYQSKSRLHGKRNDCGSWKTALRK